MKANGEFTILIRPVVTEKTAGMAQDNQYVFLVHPDSNKIQVKDAVQKAFKVKVINVRTLTLKGKAKKRGWRTVRRSDQKRAIVTLAKGSQLDPSALT